MLCPEVCHFAAPKSNFTVETDPKSDFVDKFVYNHLVSAILPGSSESLKLVLTSDADYYKVHNLRIEELASKTFISNFIKSGSLHLLSINSRIDCDNCIAVTPTGDLHLNLDKITYQGLGLEGKVSHFHSKNKERYTVRIDLKKANAKTIQCLQRLEAVTVIVQWEPPELDVCPSSVAKYFDKLQYKVELCKTESTDHTFETIDIPDIRETDSYDFVEWLGMVTLGADLVSGTPDNFLTTYQPPHVKNTGSVTCIQWRGFFTAEQMRVVVKELQSLVQTLGWAALYVQGFSDSPVAWKNEEHHFYTNGDNGYILLMDEKGNILCKQECTKKRYTNKVKSH